MKQHLLRIGITALLLALTVIPTFLLDRFALTREGIFHGEYWRIFSSQIVHMNTLHALMNIAGFLIVSLAFRDEVSQRRELTILFISMLCVALGVLRFSPQIHWYVGMSGAIYGVLMHHLIIGMRRTPVISGAFLLFVLVKTAYEQWISGPNTLTAEWIGGAVAIDAHLYGVVTGLVTGGVSVLVFQPAAPTKANCS